MRGDAPRTAVEDRRFTSDAFDAGEPLFGEGVVVGVGTEIRVEVDAHALLRRSARDEQEVRAQSEQ